MALTYKRATTAAEIRDAVQLIVAVNGRPSCDPPAGVVAAALQAYRDRSDELRLAVFIGNNAAGNVRAALVVVRERGNAEDPAHLAFLAIHPTFDTDEEYRTILRLIGDRNVTGWKRRAGDPNAILPPPRIQAIIDGFYPSLDWNHDDGDGTLRVYGVQGA